MDSSDPIIASYDVFLTDSDIERYVFQYLDREIETKHGSGGPYDQRHGQKPVSLKLKPKTGLVEIEVPITTSAGVYDVNRGLKYGEAMKQSRVLREGGSFGLAGGFNTQHTGGGGSNGGSRVKTEPGEGDEMQDVKGGKSGQTILRTQTLAGRMKEPVDGEPVYMLGAFRGSHFFLSPVSALVQLRPQLHHIDASDEASRIRLMRGRKDLDEDGGPVQAEARAVDVKVKSAEAGETTPAGNIELLKKIQDDKWETYEWFDAESEEAWVTYENYMIHQEPEDLPQLESAVDGETYLDVMSAPRVDPARPEMTGWAMKQNRRKQKGFIDVDG
ncbi:conserved hypothetical protein [Talaromyces stipitatus ATCC 10500]|uniref:Sulfite reductase beta subunit n=1 Tax=Talaromyces stipitatus (strain ATCC 10500 / CBS 375.48 / QM 6759 / NRRL 1006) TaxID=441959 RepID=B8MRE9_TALSN|nr:uncharacterized protein TSTA_055460 [Talaromyces stipitatus ATCC 10500]EED13044.1 conserved hypothetical protein [Talaromyces stipitatus ATCC 10500]